MALNRKHHLVFCTLALLLFGCSSDPPAEDITVPEPDPIMGGPCVQDSDCPVGNTCQISVFSSRPFCTVECDFVSDICHVAAGQPNAGEYIIGFRCIEMPPEFEGTLHRFCAPECDTLADCEPLGTGFDSCDEPNYKGLPTIGFDAGAFKVCSAPPISPEHPVDPILCDWQEKIPGPSNVKGICQDFCEYLFTCQENPEGLTMNCCGWHCFLWTTPGGTVNDTRKAASICFINAFHGATGTAKVCTAPLETCGDPLEFNSEFE